MNKISDSIQSYILALYFIMISESTNATEHSFNLIVILLMNTRLSTLEESFISLSKNFPLDRIPNLMMLDQILTPYLKELFNIMLESVSRSSN